MKIFNKYPYLIAEIGVNFYDIAKKEGMSDMAAAKFMIDEAKECGIDSIGVLYGTDGPEELKNATYIAKDVEELKNILL